MKNTLFLLLIMISVYGCSKDESTTRAAGPEVQAPKGTPMLYYPQDHQDSLITPLPFTWSVVPYSDGFDVSIFVSKHFKEYSVFERSFGEDPSFILTDLIHDSLIGREIYWKVRATNIYGKGPWSSYNTFKFYKK